MPKTLARSVSASAGMRSAAAASTASSMRTMPSTIEYSLCRRRWMNSGTAADALRGTILLASAADPDDRHLADTGAPRPRALATALVRRLRVGPAAVVVAGQSASFADGTGHGTDDARQATGAADEESESARQRQSAGLSVAISARLRRRVREHRQRRAQGPGAFQKRWPVPHRMAGWKLPVQEEMTAERRSQ